MRGGLCEEPCGPLFGGHRALARIVSRRCSEASCCGEAGRLEALSKGWSARDGRYVTQALVYGGWLCRALFLLDPELRGSKGSISDVSRLAGLDALCGVNATVPSRNEENFVVVGVHHNGLGNTLYQYATARLMAWSMGARYASSLIVEREGAMNLQIAPHSREAWRAFYEIFEPPNLNLDLKLGATVNGSRRLDAPCARLVPMRSEYVANGTIIFGERPADKRRRRPRETLRELVAALRRPSARPSALRCVKLIGFFQDYALYRGVMPLVKAWLPVRSRDLATSPSPSDVVLHVRLCDGPYHVYKYYSVENYFGPILDRLRGRPIRLVTACSPFKPGVTRDLVDKYGALVTRPEIVGSNRPGAPEADFIYMTRATTLVICESTFSWWAAALSNATVVHAPGTGVLPVAWDDPRYVFHDVSKRAFYGRFDGRTIRYNLRTNRSSTMEEEEEPRRRHHHHHPTMTIWGGGNFLKAGLG